MAQTSEDETKKKEEGGSLLQLEAIVEESHDAIIGKTLDGVITSWNGGAKKMFGYSPEEVIGKPMINLFPPELKDELPRLLENVRRGEIIADYDSVWLRKDGTRADVEFSISPVHTESGTIIGASLVGRDISTRKKAEESMSQVQLIVENSQDAIIGETLDGIITSWNGGAVKMMGYSAEEAIGKSILSFVPPESKEEVSSIFKKIEAGEVVVDYDSVRLHKDGTKIEVAFSSSPIHDKDGKIVGVSCVERDITKRKWFEARILRMSKLYAALSQCNKAVSHCKNEDELFLEVCNAVVQFGGMTMAWIGLIDKTSKIVKPISSFGAGQEYLKNIQISVDANSQFGNGPTGIAIRENRPIWIQDFINDETTTPWHEHAKNVGWRASAALPLLLGNIPIGSLTLYSDIKNSFDDDAQKLLIEIASDISFSLNNFADKAKQNKDIEHIKELNEMRNKFITIISHQLRTPLTSINWNLETILNGSYGKLEDTQYKFLKATHVASVDITNRINDLLTAMDIEEGRVVFQKEEASIESIAAAIVNEMTKRCQLKNISLLYIAPVKDLPSIEVDSEKIRMIITKLIENAVIYTKDGGKITITLEERDGVIHFEVKDNGIGIPEQEQHRVHNRFFRASNASVMKPDAFGIGLFIAKNFVEQHGGKIGFKSKENEGSTFWFELPIKSGI